ncbi:MAG: FAD-dependent oxidoreductase [Candidatus Rokubacteria bacterium]|nr:FAD-dependent oxidoreductase [Candidatus Rokubacteria bacterium]
MNRRQFLAGAGLAAGSLAACSLNFQPLPTGSSGQARKPKKIIIVGAGLAGLATGDELSQAGHDVAILEARPWPGGRVHTIREPFADGLYAESGALFIPDNHRLVLKYARLFNLPLRPSMPLAAARLFYVRGKRLVPAPRGHTDWPLDLTGEERNLGRVGIWEKYIASALTTLGDIKGPGWPAAAQLGYDRMSMAEFLRSQGASAGAIALVRLGYLDLIGDGIDSYSALFMLRNLALRQTEKQVYSFRGGNDLLPKAFATRLAPRIRYNSPVVRIEPGERSASVVVANAGGHERLTADHVVCTVPFSVLRHIEISPPLSRAKQLAIEQLPYTSVARVYLQSRRRFWLDANPYVYVDTDLPIMWIFDQTGTQPGPRGVLEGQAVGAEARRIMQMRESDRIRFALDQMEQVFPGARGNFERGATKCWDEDPWARGAYAYFRPGEMRSFLPHFASPEGRVHFAGEHTSPWAGWMQGALESGLRVAGEITGVIRS